MTEEELDARRAEIVQEVGRLVSEYASIQEDHPVFVLGWAVSYEGTSIELESNDMALRGAMVPPNQMISASLGLGVYLQAAFNPVPWFGEDDD